MKIMTVLGSPRKNGNTAKVLEMFEEMIAKEHQIDRLNLASSQVNSCLGCSTCKKTEDEPGCVQKDDALAIFGRMMDADVVVYASPVYWWDYSSQMKAFIDRHFCLKKSKHSLLAGKRTAQLLTCNGPVENNVDLVQKLFDRMNNYLESQPIGKYVLPRCKVPDTLDSRAMEVAKSMAQDIKGI